MTSRARALLGTDEPIAAARTLAAGRLSAVLDAGSLRGIRFRGVELIRGVSFLLRDAEWGTASTEITDLEIEEDGERFTVTWRATCGGDSGFAYDARIEGLASGRLVFRAAGVSQRDFLTNRVGFIVLHPLHGVAGRPMTIEHVDGSVETSTMPELISPDQPAMAIRVLSHEAAPGLRVACRTEGDAFEMEDQRNWSDASFKTYVRPLALPRPFRVPAGERIVQSVTITISGHPHGASENAGSAAIAIGEPAGAVPTIALGIDPAPRLASEQARILAALGPRRLVARIDARDAIDGGSLARLGAVRAGLGARLTLELILPAIEPDREIGIIVAAIHASGLAVDAVVPTGAYDLRMRPSNSEPVGAASPAELVEAARRAFAGADIGGGVLTGFPEFNRNPPPAGADFVTHTTCAIVHAADDRSVMQTIEALPHIFRSARVHAAGRPHRIGPSGIGMRTNPAGSTTAANPSAIRLAMASADPRQDGLFAAAWTLAYVAEAARAGVEEVALADLAGPFGVIGAAGQLRPLFHVLRGLSQLSRAPARTVSGMPEGVAALAADSPDGLELWIANLTATDIVVTIKGRWQTAMLDFDTFTQARRDAGLLDGISPAGGSASLGPYAVARLVGVPDNRA